jgi:hypothetical protein
MPFAGPVAPSRAAASPRDLTGVADPSSNDVEGTILRGRHAFPASALVLAVLVSSSPSEAQAFEVDASACRGMHDVLLAMRDGEALEKVSGMLDGLLATRPYRVLFQHYNREWRPDHLPVATFKRMILGLQYAGQYVPGENERADAMRLRWAKFYPELAVYEKQLRQLEATDVRKVVEDSIDYAQSWLPPGWEIPSFYLPVVPNGGSPAFTIHGVQGYDFLQLSRTDPGEIDLEVFAANVAHESHHLGMRSPMPEGLTAAEALAYRVVTLTVAEGAATAFMSGAPAGRVPASSDVRFHSMKGDLEEAWNRNVAAEEEILERQVAMLSKALAGALTETELHRELNDYWLSGLVGRAYVLGAEMFGAIYLAHGRSGVFSAMADPRKLFALYNSALDARPKELRRCVRVPQAAVEMALGIGRRKEGPPRAPTR